MALDDVAEKHQLDVVLEGLDADARIHPLHLWEPSLLEVPEHTSLEL